MHILITGAGGFVGRGLVRRLLASADSETQDRVTRLTLLDVAVGPIDDPRVRVIEGDLADASLLQAATAVPVDVVYHLASVPGGAAEQDYELGRRVNLDGTQQLIDVCRRARNRPRFVFASSIAVYGHALPSAMDESSPAIPVTSYGAHKLIGEILVSDATRRGELDGWSLRLPGVVARPPVPSGLVSAFMSNLFWAVRDAAPITLPVSASATAWWMSRQRCIDNLLHAGRTSWPHASHSPVVLPVLRCSIHDVLDALGERFGRERLARVSFEPQPRVQALFGAYPELATPKAQAAGFCSDGSVQAMLDRIFGCG
ncbi:NAD-dependent epimerase/dehydratase family protein [Ralstonia sp. 22086]|uniref:NAD-dependent epimerase/dehydratase family protein n=1 Tax=Ralstonia sp. 22086 TaxID=3453870 RepID=UPI003F8553A6